MGDRLDYLLCQDISMHEVLQKSAAFLAECGIEDAQNDAWLLMEYVTGISRAMYLVYRQNAMNEGEKIRYGELLRKRGRHIPLQHLTGEQEFMGFPFFVNEHVLIPRQDTEILVEEALKVLRPGMRVLDLCTGSGCIAVSLKKMAPFGISVDASDVSAKALKVARKNAADLNAEIEFIHSDLFEKISGPYDMIVSNPPYIRTSVIEELTEEVRLHEPFGALDGKEDGLYFYRIIVDQGKNCLKKGGWMLFEIGYDQGEAVRLLMEEAGFETPKIGKDLAGLDRVVYARLEKNQEESTCLTD